MTVPDKLHRPEENADHIDEYMIGKWGVLGLAYRQGDAPAPTQLAAWIKYVLAAAFGRSEPPTKPKA